MAPQKSKFVFYLLACCALAVVLCAEGADASLLRRHSRLPAASPPPSCAFAVRVVDLKPSPPVAHEPVTVVLAFTSVADAITNCFIGAEIDGVVQPWSDTLLGFPPGATYTRIMNFQAPAPGAHDLVLFARAGPAKGGSATDIFWQELKVSPRP